VDASGNTSERVEIANKIDMRLLPTDHWCLAMIEKLTSKVLQGVMPPLPRESRIMGAWWGHQRVQRSGEGLTRRGGEPAIDTRHPTHRQGQ
jgi:hypothetical protein